MKILWTKVTWYSQTLAIILFIVVLGLGIYIGQEYQKIIDGNVSDAPASIIR